MDITFEDGRKSTLSSTIAIHDIAARRSSRRGRRPRMSEDLGFFIALMLSGVSIGLMYSLIALGFVLVYKATDAINFAQGEFVMLAGADRRRVVVLERAESPLIAAVVVVLAVMIGFGFGLERVVLRPLLGRPVVAVIMATIGARRRAARPDADHLRRRDARAAAADRRRSDRDRPGDACRRSRCWARAWRSLFFLVFNWFFKKSRMGVAMRAVADNQQVAQAMGINVERYFALAWAMAGIVSALGGIVWGSMLGVDVQLALVGLKVFPVVILGGLDSIGGALVGGLIVGIVESLAAGYLDPYVGGGTKDFAPYVLMILVLMFRPYGIFGTTHRSSACSRCSIAKPESSRPPTAPTWRSIRCRSPSGRWSALAVLFVVVVPLTLHEYYLSILNLIFIAVVGALGLNILVGYTGQISIGHGAFMSVGAYTAANLAVQLGLPFWLTLPAGGLMAALIGVVVGMPEPAHQGPLSRDRHAGRPAHHRMDDQPRAGDLGRRAGLDPGAAARACSASPRTPRAGSTSSCCSSPCSRSSRRSTWCAAASAAPSSRCATRTSPPRSSASTSSATSCSPFAISSFYAGVCGVLYTYYFGIANYEQFQLDRLDRLSRHDHHRRPGLGAGLDLRRDLRHLAADRDPHRHGECRLAVLHRRPSWPT